eukprot:m.442708 g.442708  ORF g.442708 m.442708 type:complete len:229 (-) comp18843_c0_seq1:96-782(-)
MSDENYAVELEQVRAALALDPTNADLIKLEADLKDIIALSSELEAKPATKKPTAKQGSEWRVGDECEAVWATDGQYYSAVIETISGGECTVAYKEYADKGVVKLSSLRKRAKRSHDTSTADTGTVTAKDAMTRAEKEAERERKKLKREKKKEKLEEKKKQAVDTQSSWKKFNSGASKRSKTGFKSGKKESIFKTPDSVNGKVGVGTCNIGGKGMTGDFTKRDKWQYKS